MLQSLIWLCAHLPQKPEPIDKYAEIKWKPPPINKQEGRNYYNLKEKQHIQNKTHDMHLLAPTRNTCLATILTLTPNPSPNNKQALKKQEPAKMFSLWWCKTGTYTYTSTPAQKTQPVCAQARREVKRSTQWGLTYMLSQNLVCVLGLSWFLRCLNQRWTFRTSQSSCLDSPSRWREPGSCAEKKRKRRQLSLDWSAQRGWKESLDLYNTVSSPSILQFWALICEKDNTLNGSMWSQQTQKLSGERLL